MKNTSKMIELEKNTLLHLKYKICSIILRTNSSILYSGTFSLINRTIFILATQKLDDDTTTIDNQIDNIHYGNFDCSNITLFDKFEYNGVIYFVYDKCPKYNDTSTSQLESNEPKKSILKESDKSRNNKFKNRIIIFSIMSVLIVMALLGYFFNWLGYDLPTSGAVDLGLSVYWNASNVGASKPEDSGNFYAWGEVETKKEYEEHTSKHIGKRGIGDYIYIGDDISGTKYDAAHVIMGNGWRMPTKAEIEELVNKCDWRYIEYNNINGFIVTGPSGKSIFLPDAGHMEGKFHYGITYYWTSTFHKEKYRNCNAWNIMFESNDTVIINHIYQRRYVGRLIRPVKNIK